MTAGPLAALPVPGLVGGAADLVLQVAPAAVDAARDAVAGWLALLRGPLAGTAADAWARLAPALAALGPLTAVAGAIRSCRHVFVHARSDGARTHLFGEPDDEPLRSEPVSRPRCSGPPSSHRHVEAGPRSRTAPRPERANGVPVGHAVVGRGGFEPPKAMPADLQSAPFVRSGTDPGRHHASACATAVTTRRRGR
jgi:hypothetical protein